MRSLRGLGGRSRSASHATKHFKPRASLRGATARAAFMRATALLFLFVLVLAGGVAAQSFDESYEPSPSAGNPGALDSSFGVGGVQSIRWINLINTGGYGDRADVWAVTVQPDGKILVGGESFVQNTNTGFSIARLNPDGRLDAGFGDGGLVRTRVLGGQDSAYDVEVQPDGKIVAAGTAYAGYGFTYEFALVRYNPDGSLDATFGNGGKVTTDFGGNDEAHEILIQPDGKIVLVGFKINDLFALARYNPDGSLDQTFGVGGRVTTNFGSGRSLAYAAVLQPDGKIVAAGDAYTAATSSDFALARYNPDGSLDQTFGAGGKVTTDFNRAFDDFSRDLVLQPDGRIVAGGWAENNCALCGAKADFALARYNPNGTLDPTFDGDGRVVIDMSRNGESEMILGIALQRNGRIVGVGRGPTVNAPGGSHTDFLVARFNPGGDLDTSFGDAGRVLIDFGVFNPPGPPTYGANFTGDGARAVTIQPDGKIVVAGEVVFGRHRHDMGVARLVGDPLDDGDELPPGEPPLDFITPPEPPPTCCTPESDPPISRAAGVRFKNEIEGANSLW